MLRPFSLSVRSICLCSTLKRAKKQSSVRSSRLCLSFFISVCFYRSVCTLAFRQHSLADLLPSAICFGFCVPRFYRARERHITGPGFSLLPLRLSFPAYCVSVEALSGSRTKTKTAPGEPPTPLPRVFPLSHALSAGPFCLAAICVALARIWKTPGVENGSRPQISEVEATGKSPFGTVHW